MTSWESASISSKFNMGAGAISILFGLFLGAISFSITLDMLIHSEFGIGNLIVCGIPIVFIVSGWYTIKKESQINNAGDITPCHF